MKNQMIKYNNFLSQQFYQPMLYISPNSHLLLSFNKKQSLLKEQTNQFDQQNEDLFTVVESSIVKQNQINQFNKRKRQQLQQLPLKPSDNYQIKLLKQQVDMLCEDNRILYKNILTLKKFILIYHQKQKQTVDGLKNQSQQAQNRVIQILKEKLMKSLEINQEKDRQNEYLKQYLIKLKANFKNVMIFKINQNEKDQLLKKCTILNKQNQIYQKLLIDNKLNNCQMNEMELKIQQKELERSIKEYKCKIQLHKQNSNQFKNNDEQLNLIDNLNEINELDQALDYIDQNLNSDLQEQKEQIVKDLKQFQIPLGKLNMDKRYNSSSNVEKRKKEVKQQLNHILKTEEDELEEAVQEEKKNASKQKVTTLKELFQFSKKISCKFSNLNKKEEQIPKFEQDTSTNKKLSERSISQKLLVQKQNFIDSSSIGYFQPNLKKQSYSQFIGNIDQEDQASNQNQRPYKSMNKLKKLIKNQKFIKDDNIL